MWADVLATDGLWLLFFAAGLAGLVRGFSGFGTGMIYVPLAAQVLSPVWVLISIMVIDVLGPIPIIPRTLRESAPKDVMRLMIGALIGVPLGVMVLLILPVDLFRYAVSVLTLALLVLLIMGYRFKGTVGAPMTVGIGMSGGFMAGSVGLPGPPVIFFYMSRALSPAVIRANIMLYLFLVDALLLCVLFLRGILETEPLLIGFILMPIYGLAIMVGALIFDPERETQYRYVAYAVIAFSALSGLAFWH